MLALARPDRGRTLRFFLNRSRNAFVLNRPQRRSSRSGTGVVSSPCRQATLSGLVVRLAVSVLGTLVTASASAAPSVPQATAGARLEQRQQQTQQIRPENYDLRQHPVNDANERFWRNILWTTAVVEPEQPYVTTALVQILALTARSDLSHPQMRTVDMAMQVATQLYTAAPDAHAALETALLHTLSRSSDPQWVAMALKALSLHATPEQQQQWMQQVQQRFPNWRQEVSLYAALQDLTHRQTADPMPPLADLLNWSIAPNQLQLYVLCRPDRGVLCQTVLRDRNGQFVRQDNQLWSVPLLLRSIHNLSWMFPRGQTPQGLYRIEGTVPQPDTEFFRAYGLFALVKLFVPFEAGVREFVPGRAGPLTGSLTAYQNLLPPSWRNYFPIQQTYWAGKAGRALFRIHGSGEAPSFFSNNQRYPGSGQWNPTIGCLSALELYDESGRLQQADMPRILEALHAHGGPQFTGYLIVVEVPGDADIPVSLAEVETVLAAR